MKLLFLGAGKMCESMLKGWESDLASHETWVFSPSGESARKLCQRFNLKQVEDLSLLNHRFDVIFLCCKPQQLREVPRLLTDELREALFVSILAAVPLEFQKKILGVKKIFRLMPSLPVEHNKGISLVYPAIGFPPQVLSLISRLGFTHLCQSEEEFTKLTLLTASGPGVIAHFTQQYLASFDIKDESLGDALAKNLLWGVGEWVQKSPLSLQELVSNVCSKGGVTEVLNQTFDEVIPQTSKKALKMALQRGEVISHSLQK